MYCIVFIAYLLVSRKLLFWQNDKCGYGYVVMSFMLDNDLSCIHLWNMETYLYALLKSYWLKWLRCG